MLFTEDMYKAFDVIKKWQLWGVFEDVNGSI